MNSITEGIAGVCVGLPLLLPPVTGVVGGTELEEALGTVVKLTSVECNKPVSGGMSMRPLVSRGLAETGSIAMLPRDGPGVG